MSWQVCFLHCPLYVNCTAEDEVTFPEDQVTSLWHLDWPLCQSMDVIITVMFYWILGIMALFRWPWKSRKAYLNLLSFRRWILRSLSLTVYVAYRCFLHEKNVVNILRCRSQKVTLSIAQTYFSTSRGLKQSRKRPLNLSWDGQLFCAFRRKPQNSLTFLSMRSQRMSSCFCFSPPPLFCHKPYF